MTNLDIASSPRALSPTPVKGDTLRGDTLSIPSSLAGRRESHDSEGTSRSQSVRMDVSGPPTDSEPEIEREDGSRSLPRERARTGPPGDDAGPRFGMEDASKDSRAKPGEAGHSGIYNGDDVSPVHSFGERQRENKKGRELTR
jgi:hypothetical protein